MIAHLRSVSKGVLLLGAVFTPPLANAQAGRRVARPPGELIAAFVRKYQTLDGASSAAGSDIAQVLTYPDEYPAADLEVFLQGLEQLAVTGDSSRLRARAAIFISLPGSRRKPHPVLGTFARLERIYHRSNDPLVRGVLVAGMADLAERQEAIVFLERIAVKAPEDADFPGSAGRAVVTLVAMDDEGRTALKRLHESGTVRDPSARHSLSVMARRGYRIIPRAVVPDSMTAIRIARAVWIPTYGEVRLERQQPFKAVLKDTVWVVTGSRPAVGESPSATWVARAEISMWDGRILSVSVDPAVVVGPFTVEHDSTGALGALGHVCLQQLLHGLSAKGMAWSQVGGLLEDDLQAVRPAPWAVLAHVSRDRDHFRVELRLFDVESGRKAQSFVSAEEGPRAWCQSSAVAAAQIAEFILGPEASSADTVRAVNERLNDR